MHADHTPSNLHWPHILTALEGHDDPIYKFGIYQTLLSSNRKEINFLIHKVFKKSNELLFALPIQLHPGKPGLN